MPAWLGRTLGAVAGIQFGPGVLGRLGSVVIATVIVLCVIAVVVGAATQDLSGLMMIVYLVVGVAVFYLLIGFAYALINPEAAAMESAHLMEVRLRDLGAKNITLDGRARVLLDANPSTNPVDQSEGAGSA